MSDRSVSIDLIAKVSGFVASMKTAQASVRSFTTDIEKSAKKQQALRELGNAAGAMGLVAAGGFFLAVKAAANFDSAMSKVQAATHESAANMDLLRQAAIDAGQKTVFSATESADAITALSKAGVTSKDILGGGLAGALSLASAGELDVASAAEIAATAMNQFGLQGKDVPHIADLLAAAAGKAMGSVTDMATSLKYVGPVAAQMGISIEETTGTIAELAQAGVQGDQAGTSLRGMLTALTSPSKIAKTEMDKLGISMYDATGNFVGLNGVAGQLHDKMSVLSNAERDQALGRIFGNQQITAARILYAGGAKDVDKWTAAVNDQGYAAETAAIKMDNLHGDLEQLRGSLETALIGTGEGATGPLRELVQLLTTVTNLYIGLPAPVKGGVLALTGFLAVAGGGLFVLSRLVSGLASARTNMATLGLKGPEVNKGMLAMRAGVGLAGAGLVGLGNHIGETDQAIGHLVTAAGYAAIGFSVGGPWGAAIGGAAGLVMGLARTHYDAAGDVQALTATLDAQTGALTSNSGAWVASKLADAGLIGSVKDLGLSASDVTDAVLNGGPALDSLSAKLETYRVALGQSTSGNSDLTGAQIETSKKAADLQLFLRDLSGTASDAKDEFKFTAEAAASAGGKLKGTAGDAKALGGATADTTKKVLSLADALSALNQPTLDQRSAQRAYQAALDDADASLKKNGRTLDDHTKKGRENADSLDAIASSAMATAGAMEVNGQATRQSTNYLKDARSALYNQAIQFGMTKDAAHKYVNEVLAIPKKAHTEITIGTNGAYASLAAIRQHLADLPDEIVNVNVHTGAIGHLRDGGLVRRLAGGGLLDGPGGPRDDNIPIWASAGEFIVNAAATSRNLGLLHSINAQGFAAGGTVSRDQQRSDIDALTQAIRALTGGVKHFNIKPGDDASAARSAVHDLISQLRDVVGKDSHLLAHITKLGDRIVDLSKAQDRATTKYDNATAKLDRLQQASAAYASTVKSAFTHDPLTGSLASSTLQLRADRNDARSAGRDLTTLRHRHLSGALLKNLQASGNTALIDELAGASNRDLHAYEALYRSTNKATSRIGSQSANAVLGRQMHQQTEVTHRLHKSIDSLNHRIDHLEGAIERGSNKGTRLGIQDRDHRAAVLRNARR